MKFTRKLRRLSLMMALLLATQLAAAKEPSATDVAGYEPYSNDRFNFELFYPSKLLFPQGESVNGDGQKFVSKDKKTTLVAYGSYGDLFDGLDATKSLNTVCEEDRHPDPKYAPNRKVTYSRQHDNWCVVSGTDGENIFYMKRYVVGDKTVVFKIVYPNDQRKIWDKVTSQIGKQFWPGPAPSDDDGIQVQDDQQ